MSAYFYKSQVYGGIIWGISYIMQYNSSYIIYSFISFGKYIQSYNHHNSEIREHFYPPQNFSHVLCGQCFPPPVLRP